MGYSIGSNINYTGSAYKYSYKNNTVLTNWLTNSCKINDFGNPLTVRAMVKANAGFDPYSVIKDYVTALGDSPMGDYNNSTGEDGGYYSYTQNLYDTNLQIDNSGILSDGDISDEVSSYFNNNLAGKSQDELVKIIQQLFKEDTKLKNFSIANSQIQEIIKEIDTLSGSGVMGYLGTKKGTVAERAHQEFKTQVTAIATKANNCDGQSDKYTPGAKGQFATELASVQSIFSDGEGLGGAKKTDGIDDSETDTYDIFKPVNESFAGALGSDMSTWAYDYSVALRINPKLKFSDFIKQKKPAWDTSNTKIADDTDSAVDFKVSDYTGIKAGDDELSPVDILNDLAATKELLAVAKQYETAENRARSLELALSVALQNSAEFDFRKKLAELIFSKLDGAHKYEVSDQYQALMSMERGNLISSSSSLTHKPFDGFYGDKNTKANPKTGKDSLVDPYEVVINGTKYIFGLDSDDDGSIDNATEILGISDSMENPFQSLTQLDVNKDGFVSADEMTRGRIILQSVNDKGAFTKSTLDMASVNGIDLSTLSSVKSGTSVGTFTLTLASGKKVDGSQTFENQQYFNTLFGTLADLRTSTGSTTATSTTSDTKSTSTTAASSTSTTTATSAKTEAPLTGYHDNLLKQLNSAYSDLIIDDTENIQTILDNYCWQRDVILTPAQRIRIVDGLDPLLPVYMVEKEIESAIQTLYK